ncbi:hypothetical protein BY458DRAFT_515180 [Sporodiniella umbellata]|nr:hypothetical protein BY458DRAFT_515180 [Sporodiniella umbellata]
MHINSPLPSSLASECRKASRILNSFKDEGNGLDSFIPPNILAYAKGLAIFTVLKAGFLFSGRAGSGLVVARLPDGSWSAPSAIMTGGMGFGGQVGAELTDFIMVLNNQAAVKTFMDHGSVTLGGNISVAAGPVGRNAEASGTASYRTVAAVYSYSKTRGLFAGVSLEGSVIIERFDANKKMYGYKVKARDLLNGSILPPENAEALYDALRTKFSPHTDTRFAFMNRDGYNQNDAPSTNYNDSYGSSYLHESSDSFDHRESITTSRSLSRGAVHQMAKTGYSPGLRDNRLIDQSYHSQSSNSVVPYRETQYEPRARALFDFRGEQQGDLAFRKGDVISIIKRTNTQNDWWTGKVDGRQGIFPANFVEEF